MQNDVWALGVIAVEALTGRHPFSQGGVGMATQGVSSAQVWHTCISLVLFGVGGERVLGVMGVSVRVAACSRENGMGRLCIVSMEVLPKFLPVGICGGFLVACVGMWVEG
eukprot:scaffold2686_cov22-Tisochrysis_lutea.AAC.4